MYEVLYKANAKLLFDAHNSNPTRFPPQAGDMVFFRAQGNYPNHIWVVRSVVTQKDKWHMLSLRDASANAGAKERTIIIEYKNKTNLYCVESYCYTVFYKKFLSPSELWLKKSSTAAYAYEELPDTIAVTHYNLWVTGQNDLSPCYWALVWANLCKLAIDWLTRPIALTTDYRTKYGIKARDKIVLVWDAWCAWTYTVLDNMNKRYTESCRTKYGYCIKADIWLPAWVHTNNGTNAWWACKIVSIIKHKWK